MRAQFTVLAANLGVVALQALALLVARLVERARDRRADRRGERRYRLLKRSRLKRGDHARRTPDPPRTDHSGNATWWSSNAPGVR